MMSDRLARRYRRLLLAYPRAYRRSRGDELLATLLAAAPPGRARPTPREAADLIRHGLRARLGRPASRSVVTWALMATLISGVFGAAFATRAGWETARPLPAPDETTAMLSEILPGAPWGPPTPPSGRQFSIYGEPLSWNMADDLLFGDGGEYEQTGVGAGVSGGPDVRPQQTVTEAVGNLREHGWTVSPPWSSDMYSCIGPPCDPATIPQDTTLVARRGDTVLTLYVAGRSTYDTTYLSATFTRATPPAVWPCGLAGGLLAGLVAYLLFGWASRRSEGRHPALGATVKVLFGVVLSLWWAPTVFAVPFVAEHHIREPHPSWHPMWEWLGQPAFSLFFVTGGACALLALALCTLPRRAEALLTART